MSKTYYAIKSIWSVIRYYSNLGYVILTDGYLVSGVEIGLYDDKISFNMTHWPPEVLRTKPTVDEGAITKAVADNISKILNKCLHETAMNTIKRHKEMLKEEE